MELIDEIEAFLKATEMSATAFGQKVLNDPPFVQQLRDGRDPKMSTVKKCRNFIEHYNKEGSGASLSQGAAA